MLRGLLVLLNLGGMSRLFFGLMLDRRVPLRTKLIPVAALAYFISPIDLVPDILPALGRIDDVLVIVLSLMIFLALSPRDIVAQHFRGGRQDPTKGTPEEREQSGRKVIEGSYRHVEDDKDDSR